ncbi:MAG: hypothetical protein QOG52_782 [Frankiaceae bacterium]|nr:hypothetical protein [Frankiaceae bacterium]
MELVNLERTVSVVLRPVGYEFGADVPGHGNWLVIDGQASYRRGAWAFTEPCLTAGEAQALSPWLRRVAARDEAPTTPGEDGKVWPSLMFTEPNLSYGVARYDEDCAVLRLHFSLDSAPPWEPEHETLTAQFFVELRASPAMLRQAADDWDNELAAFPERP